MRQYSQRELRTVLRQWDIPQTLPIQDIYIMDGSKVSGSIWSVGENYILKTADRVELLRNLCVAKALVAQGFAAQIPILTRDGREFAEGQAIFALCRRMKGNPLPKADRFGEKRAVYGLKLGQSIARLHSALAAAEADLQPSEKNLFAQVTEWALPEVQKQNVRWRMGLPDRFFADYISGFGALFDKLPKQLIHRDPNPGNILFENGEVAGFIDFDLSERSVRLWDPCYCATGILSEWRGVDEIQAKWPDILRGILQGYDSVNPLTAEEKQALFHVICSIQMICIAYFESEDDYKELAKTSREMLRYIVEKETEIRQFFA